MKKQKQECCEECGRAIDYDREIVPTPTLCTYCAAAHYWAIKAHIKDKLLYFYNANYGKGVAFERYLKKQLEANGYYVMRSSGSHGPADLIAIKGGMVYLIQCKPDFRDLTEESKLLLMQPCMQASLDASHTKIENTGVATGRYYKHIVPLLAKHWRRVVTLLDLRTNTEVKLF